MSGHLPCTAMLSMSRNISTLNYLRSADTCLTRTVIYWLSVPAKTYSVNQMWCKQMPRFRRSLQPKIAGAHPTCDRQFDQYFPCRHLVTTSHISQSKRLRDEPRDFGNSMLTPITGYARFTTSCSKSQVFCFQPAMWKKRTILSLDQSMEMLHRQNANIVAEWNSGGRPDMKYVKRQKLTLWYILCSRTQLLHGALI